MPRIGVSTACLYPMPTERALLTLAEQGVTLTEIFFNSESELGGPVMRELRHIQRHYGIEVAAIHPFTSSYEPYLLFSEYLRRFEDGLVLYERYLAAAAELGAQFVVLHGMKANGVPIEEYARRLMRLNEIGQRYGVTVTQENCSNFQSGRPEFIRALRHHTDDAVRFTLDMKQVRRAGGTLHDMLDTMGGRVVHCHISDGGTHDCMLPGQGDGSFPPLYDALCDQGYTGGYVIEVYREAFDGPAELGRCAQQLKDILTNCPIINM